MSPKEAGGALGVSANTARRWAGKGRLRYEQPGGDHAHIRISRSDVEALRAELERQDAA